LAKMKDILVQSIYHLKRDLSGLEVDVVNTKGKIEEEVHYYC
jgi:hypothetical protein